MSYTPTTWETGDTITATKLNKMEQGIADAGGGGDEYDAVIALDVDGSQFSASIVRGNYSDLASILNNNIAPKILARVWVTNNSRLGNSKISTNMVAFYAQIDASVPYIVFFAYFPSGDNNASITLNWYADDTVVV